MSIYNSVSLDRSTLPDLDSSISWQSHWQMRKGGELKRHTEVHNTMHAH